MRNPNRSIAVLLCVAVLVFSLCAPVKAFAAFWDEDAWVTAGIITGITIGVCLVVVLVVGTLTDVFGEPEDPFFAKDGLVKIASQTGYYRLLNWEALALGDQSLLPSPGSALGFGVATEELSSLKNVWGGRSGPILVTCLEDVALPPLEWRGAEPAGPAGRPDSVLYFLPAEEQ